MIRRATDFRDLPITVPLIGVAWVSFSLLLAAGDLLLAAERFPERSPVTETVVTNQGWPFLRGPRFNGHAEDSDLADSWPASGPPVLWTRTVGQGYSAFVAWEDRVATQWQTLAGQYVVCLDAETGETVWTHRYDWPFLPGGVYPGPRATPTYAAGRLFFAAPDGLIGCLNAKDGTRLWAWNVKEHFDGKGTDFGYSCSPLLVDGKVILPVGGRGASMVALNATDGSLVWKSGDEPASYASALPIVFRDRRLIIGYLQNALVCHDLKTGELIWQRALTTGYDEHSTFPIYSEPYLWVASAFRGGSTLYELTDDDKQPIRTVWNSPLMSNDIFSSALMDGAIFGFDVKDAQAKTHRPTRGRFRCLSFIDGKPLWATGDDGPRRSADATSNADAGTRIGHANVIVADGKLILLNDTGELILARANSSKYDELARVQVLGGELCWTQPTLDHGRLYLHNQSRAVCVYVGDPSTLSVRVRENSIAVSDIPQSSYVDMASWILGVEPEYAFDLPSRRWLLEWFAVSWIGILGASFAAALIARKLARGKLSRSGTHYLFWSIAFVFGALGTTLLSAWRGDFIFTWQVSLFVTFMATIYHLQLPGTVGSRQTSGWMPRIVALLFVASCLLYFFLCRRLSLAFEWVFLCGFAPAVPFAMAGEWLFRNHRWHHVWECLMVSAAYAAFYWSSAAVLMWKAQALVP